MKWFKRLVWLVLILAAAAVAAIKAAPWLNDYQIDGELRLPGLSAPVTVKRDAKGMAYIYAQNLDDAFYAQGFVTAQDRLLQMQMSRLFAEGRIAEVMGEKGLRLDKRARAIGIHRLAKKQAALMDGPTRHMMQRYLDGVNAFIKNCPRDLPLEFKLAGIEPETWQLADSLSILYLTAFSTSGNLIHEVVAQAIIDKVGLERAREIMPLNINPDESGAAASAMQSAKQVRRGGAGLGLADDAKLAGLLESLPLSLGSNNWAVAGRFNTGGKPILAGDPHLDARILPGVWYPLGIITPELRAVGAMIPGMPGMVIGRTKHLAMAMTNAYADVQDLYIETLDPKDKGRYLEGSQSLVFQEIPETIKVKDGDAPGGFRLEKFVVRLSKRGPVVSDVLSGLAGAGSGHVVTLRWAAAESMLPSIGLLSALKAKNAAELDRALQQVSMLVLNWVFADDQGNIGWRVSGRLPIRSQGEAGAPFKVTSGQDNWTGWIPQNEMPYAMNPQKGWLATANHYAVSRDYPHYYSTMSGSSFRYARIKELLSQPGPKPASAHWQYQRDTDNLLARELAPIVAGALEREPKTNALAKLLKAWDHRDQKEQAAPLIFQAVMLEYARQLFIDELGPRITRVLLPDLYFWQERLLAITKAHDSAWFDDIRTKDKKETRDDILRRAALTALHELSERLGPDPAAWRWGQVHALELVSPLRRKGFGKELLGTGPMPMGGSAETIYRARFAPDKPFDVTICAALRMVVDMADPDKIMAVLPGGVVGRQFNPHQTDQVPAFMNGQVLYWWFSDQAISQNTKHELVLKP
jgi:penicillin amidase